jgi:hypothetical protein
VRPRDGRRSWPRPAGSWRPTRTGARDLRPGEGRANASDGVDWRAFTTLAGIEKKHTGEGEFKAPDAELAAIKALRAGKASRFVAPELADVPVNFLTTLDITGGNSGSPTLDGRGELVGLVFDGTFDTVASDFVYAHAEDALDPRRRALSAVDHDRGRRRRASRPGDGDPLACRARASARRACARVEPRRFAEQGQRLRQRRAEAPSSWRPPARRKTSRQAGHHGLTRRESARRSAARPRSQRPDAFEQARGSRRELRSP